MNVLEILTQRAEQSKDDKLQIRKYKSKLLGTEIILKKPSLTKYSEIVDTVQEADGVMETLRGNASLVYECWDLVKTNYSKLKDAYDVADPYDLILKIFEADIGELEEMVAVINTFFGIGAADEIKN